VVKLSEKLLKKWGFMNDRYYFQIKKYNHYSMKWLFLLGFHLSPYKVGTPLAVCHPDKAKPDVSQGRKATNLSGAQATDSRDSRVAKRDGNLAFFIFNGVTSGGV
jgi:hypothetical protein